MHLPPSCTLSQISRPGSDIGLVGNSKPILHGYILISPVEHQISPIVCVKSLRHCTIFCTWAGRGETPWSSRQLGLWYNRIGAGSRRLRAIESRIVPGRFGLIYYQEVLGDLQQNWPVSQVFPKHARRGSGFTYDDCWCFGLPENPARKQGIKIKQEGRLTPC